MEIQEIEQEHQIAATVDANEVIISPSGLAISHKRRTRRYMPRVRKPSVSSYKSIGNEAPSSQVCEIIDEFGLGQRSPQPPHVFPSYALPSGEVSRRSQNQGLVEATTLPQLPKLIGTCRERPSPGTRSWLPIPSPPPHPIHGCMQSPRTRHTIRTAFLGWTLHADRPAQDPVQACGLRKSIYSVRRGMLRVTPTFYLRYLTCTHMSRGRPPASAGSRRSTVGDWEEGIGNHSGGMDYLLKAD
jgi:hypothetical protein